SCDTLASHGWVCPHLKTCKYKFIAKYGAPSSLLVFEKYAKITVQQYLKLYELEQSGFFNVVRSSFSQLKYVFTWNVEAADWLPTKPEYIKDYLIARHILGTAEIRINLTQPALYLAYVKKSLHQNIR